MRVTITIVLFLVLCSATFALAEVPTRADGDDPLRRLVDALCGSEPEEALRWLDGVELRSLEGQPSPRAMMLLEQSSGSLPVVARLYSGVPQTAAADLAEGAKKAELPDSITSRLTPSTAAALEEANAVAARWIADVLQPQADQQVGLIVLWRGDALPSLPAGNFSDQIVFLLFTTEPGDNVPFKLHCLAFGNPLASAR